MTRKRMKRMDSKSVQEFILDKMAEGNDVAMIKRKWPDQVPDTKTIYRASERYPEFGRAMDRAYTSLFMHRMDELHRLSGLTAREAFPDVDDWREAEATLKRMIDEHKFVLAKMAPILSKRFDKAQKVEVSGDPLAQIAIVSYATQAPAIEKED